MRRANRILQEALQNSEICLPGGHPIEFSELEDNHNLVPPPRAVDCTTAWYFREQRTPQLPRVKKGTVSDGYVPLLYKVSEKIDESTRLKAGFAAIAISRAVGNQAQQNCIIIHGAKQRVQIISIGPIIPHVELLLAELEERILSNSAPTLVLNKHCAICDFQSRCRGLAIESDKLSLLTGMTEKERRKFEAKGVTTILQLSYGYRARRRTRKRVTSNRDRLLFKHDSR